MLEVKSRKKVRVSKNRKKSWRKHCDISDVEKHLDNERQNQILGNELENVKDADLFFLSKKPYDEAPAARKKKFTELKCFSHLRNSSAVKDPLKKRNRVRSPSEKTSEWVKRIKREAEITKPSRIQAAKYRKAADAAYRKKKKENQRAVEGKFDVFDLWDEPKEESPVIEEDLKNFYLEETRQRPARRAPHTKVKPSKLPTVEVPHPGASYNPTYRDHQELLGLANDIELDSVKKENAIYRNTTAMFPTKDEAPTEESWLKEMSGCLFDESGNESEDVSEDDDNNNTTRNATVTDDTRKTKQKRKREKRAKVKAIKTARLKNMYQRESQIYRVKKLYKEIQEEDTKKNAIRTAKRAAKQHKLDYEPRKLSRLNFVPQDLEVNLASEVTGNLRLVKTEGDLLEDRYKSLMKRNVIEPRVKHNLKKKYKRKRYRRANELTEADTKGFTVQTKRGELTVTLQKSS